MSYTGRENKDGNYVTATSQCPECEGIAIDLLIGQLGGVGDAADPRTLVVVSREIGRVYPRNSNRPPPPPEVPEAYAVDYNEASLVLIDSPKASAALSRRCLQHVLQRELKIVKANLYLEIDEAIKSHGLPSHVGSGLDSVRSIGNFAAHPEKSTASGEIIEVEDGEAEWSLDVLDALFDHLFVGPAKIRARKAALDAKIQASKG